METFTIGKLSETTGISIDTIRYYEQIGLLKEAQRKDSGFRLFNKNDIKRLNFIRKAKGLGFSLKEIKELLILRVDKETACDDVRESAQIKLKAIKKKIHELNQIKVALAKLINQCEASIPTNDCPIIEALDDENTPDQT